VDDARRCMAESGCDALMLGRGLVADPGLALALRGQRAPGWPALAPLLVHYARLIAPRVAPRHQGGRLKQWLFHLRRAHPEAQALYDRVRALADTRALVRELEQAATPAAEPEACAA
jgi:tRNA-dihydrouridine synthase C